MKIKKIGKIKNGTKMEKLAIVPCCEVSEYEVAICAYPRFN